MGNIILVSVMAAVSYIGVDYGAKGIVRAAKATACHVRHNCPVKEPRL